MEQINQMKKKFEEMIHPSFYPIGLFFLTIITISTVQWSLIQFIATYCSPWHWVGPIINIFSLGSPVCAFTNHVQIVLADYYITIWVGAAGTCIGYITKPKD